MNDARIAFYNKKAHNAQTALATALNSFIAAYCAATGKYYSGVNEYGLHAFTDQSDVPSEYTTLQLIAIDCNEL